MISIKRGLLQRNALKCKSSVATFAVDDWILIHWMINLRLCPEQLEETISRNGHYHLRLQPSAILPSFF